MIRTLFTLTGFALVLGVAVSACGGESGDSCRAKSDCQGSLICCREGAAATGGQRGACQAECVLPTIDAGVDSGP